MIALLSLAHARPDCTALDAASFRSALLDAQVAADRADVALQGEIVDNVLQRVPCLEFAPTPRMWADFLAVWALTEFTRGGDWQGPLTAALWLRPTLDRGVDEGHPLGRFEPPPLPEGSGPPVPPGLTVFVDGLASASLPPAQGIHLVQKSDDGYWDSVLVRGEPVSADWLAAPIDRPATLRWWAHVGVHAGGGMVMQRTSWTGDPAWFPASDWPRGLAGAGTRGVALYGTLGVAGEAGLDLANLERPSNGWAQVAGLVRLGASAAGAGLGITGVPVMEGEPYDDEPEYRQRELGAWYGHASVVTRSGRWDGAASAGLGPGLLRATADAGLGGPGRARFGLSGTYQTALLRHRSGDQLTASASSWRLVASVGLRWDAR